MRTIKHDKKNYFIVLTFIQKKYIREYYFMQHWIENDDDDDDKKEEAHEGDGKAIKTKKTSSSHFRMANE